MPSTLGAMSKRVPIAFLIVAALLHSGYLLHHRVNIDEPQHLHVAWSWAHGLLPYRDVFDNHSPLFSYLMAPVVGAVGERPDIVLWGRLAMVPFTLVTLVITWALARRLFSRDAALWAVALAALVPDFMLGSVEYRTDQLWTALWMAAVAVALSGRPTKTRSFALGLALGAALGTSMKTSLWIVSMAFAAGVTAVLLRSRGVKLGARWFVERGLLLLGGMAIVAGAIAAPFAAQGAWRSMVYCVVGHNVVPNLGSWADGWFRALLLPAALPFLWIVARRVVDRAPDPSIGAQRAVLVLTAGFYYVVLEGFWPLVTRQDVLPFLPMAAVAVAPALLEASRNMARRAQVPWRALRFAPALILLMEIGWTQRVEAVWRDNDVGVEVSFLKSVLRLTRPGDTVMDLRGETIFRTRPYYYVLEPITLARINSGLIADDIPEHLVAARTPVAVPDTPDLPPRCRSFLNENYITVENLRVVGRRLDSDQRRGLRPFAIGIPQRYAVIGAHGPASGVLDGTPYRGPRDLAAGMHRYVGSESEGLATVIWSEAVARSSGFSR
jgi:dolichyl-phosphate-mannose-protein mannosyltransferase